MTCCNDVPSRWRLCLASLWLAIAALFDPAYVASIFAIGLTGRRRLQRKEKLEALCNVKGETRT